MKSYNKLLIFSIFVLMVFTLQGCELIGNIFGAGVWVGVIISAIVVFIIVFVVIKILKSLFK